MEPKKILLVDDDSDFLESLQLIIFEEGHRVYPISNGNDALLQYKKIKPDIVFLDLKMPGMDGYETCKNILKHDPKAQVVFMSGHMIDVVKHGEIKKSIVGTIIKPIHFGEIKKIIKKYTKIS